MYFPYLRGKQNEIAAIEELQTIIERERNVIPIFEMVTSLDTNSKKLKRLLTKEIPFIIIVNPIVGEYKNNYNEILRTIYELEKTSDDFMVGINITSDLTNSDFKFLIEKLKPYEIALIHHQEFNDLDYILEINNSMNIGYNILAEKDLKKTYKNRIKDLNNSVLLDDGFNKEKRNADYPSNTFFSEDIFEYKNENYVGFSDFTTVGKEYSKGGGQPYAVAIHLSQLYCDCIRVNHFISDDVNYPGNAKYKFFQALNKLVDYINNQGIIETQGIKDFKFYYEKEHYPNLGPVKRSSIKHHIEMISSNI